MNDLVDSTAFLVSTGSVDPWVTAVSVLRSVSVSLRTANEKELNPALVQSADWIDAQIQEFQQSASKLKCILSPVKQI